MMKAEQLDEMFDRGDDITPYLDLASLRRPNLEQKPVSVEFAGVDDSRAGPSGGSDRCDATVHHQGLAQ